MMKRKILSIIICVSMLSVYFTPLVLATNNEENLSNKGQTLEDTNSENENTSQNEQNMSTETSEEKEANTETEVSTETKASEETETSTETEASDKKEISTENEVKTETKSEKKDINSVKKELTYEKNGEESSNNEVVTTNKKVEYSSHIENIGWTAPVNSGISGTEGKNLKMEALKVSLCLEDEDEFSVSYMAHVENIGWQNWVSDGKVAGTTGKNLRMEALKLKLNDSSKYSILYRVFVENMGWQEWKKNGETAGTTGKGLRIEAIEIKVEQNSDYIEDENLDGLINYKGHIQNIGDTKYVKDGEIAGSIGKGLRMEGLKIKLGQEISDSISLEIDEHIENIGWKRGLTQKNYIGTKGQSLKIEALSFKLRGTQAEYYTIEYRVHIQNIGWQEWKKDGEIAGTTGQNLRIEAIQIKITPKEAKANMYIDTQNNTIVNSPTNMIVSGWKMSNMSKAKLYAYLDDSPTPINDEFINYKKRDDVISKVIGFGTAEQNPYPGFSINIPTEDLNIGKHSIKLLVMLDDVILKEDSISFEVTRNFSLGYSGYVQNIGLQENVENGNVLGVTGQKLRLENIKIDLYNSDIQGQIKYSTHVAEIGWMDYVNSGEIAGTTGQNLRIEAIKIELTDELLEKYDIYYRTHVENYGWLAWTKNGKESGTEGLSFRVEAIQLQLVEKGTQIDTTGNAFIKKPVLSYTAHVQNIGWQEYVKEGEIIGTTGRELSIEALKMKLEDVKLSGTIQSSAHVAEIGWMDFVNAGTVSGTEGRKLRVEAIKIKLTDDLEKYFDIYYRAHVEDFGWLAWAKNGEAAGSSGYQYRMEALQIKLVIKGEEAPGGRSGHYYNKVLERKSIEGVKLILGNVCAGIDVSKHNGTIDWSSVKNQSDFAIIRCAFGRNTTEYDDKKFEENIQGCIANGIPVDVYLYSYADSTGYASSEADHVIRLCEKYKNYIGKIWYDVEDDSVFDQIRAGTLSKEGLGQIVDTFANRLRNAGYDVGVYTYISALNSYFPNRIKNDYEIWIAHYPGESQDIFESLYNTYRKVFKLWQFTSEGSINGVNGNVDLSFRF